jgi:hypothetical protein
LRIFRPFCLTLCTRRFFQDKLKASWPVQHLTGEIETKQNESRAAAG